MKTETASFLGLAKKAGKISFGFDAVCECLLKEETKIILVSSDLSPKTVKEVEKKADERQIKVLTLPLSMDEIDYAIGKRTGIISVNDAGFAEKLGSMATGI